MYDIDLNSIYSIEGNSIHWTWTDANHRQRSLRRPEGFALVHQMSPCGFYKSWHTGRRRSGDAGSVAGSHPRRAFCASNPRLPFPSSLNTQTMPNIPSNTRVGIAVLYAAIFTGFGLNVLLRPENGLSWFEWQPPAVTDTANYALFENMSKIYGIRDVYGGLAILLVGVLGNNKSLGAILLATAAMAVGDGYVCYLNGHGEWNHWCYAPMLAGVGGWLMS